MKQTKESQISPTSLSSEKTPKIKLALEEKYKEQDKKEQNKADVILAMYHDQGLPVIKTMGFGTVTNISLGLPFIRTSVDHGTAYDLAGSIEVDESSLIEAAIVAAKLSKS